MRIAIDLQGAQTGSRLRGIGRYSLALAKEMARQASDHDLWICLNGAFEEQVQELREEFNSLIPPSRICVYEVPHAIAERLPGNGSRARIAELIRESFLADIDPDVVHISSLFEGWIDQAVTSIGSLSAQATAVTLYDLIPFLNPQSYLASNEQLQWYNRKLASLKKSNLMLAISDYSRREVIETLGIAGDTVVNISSAVADIFRAYRPSDGVRMAVNSRYSISSPYLLYSGVFESRKNIDRLLEAFALLPGSLKQHYQLVLVGAAGDYERTNIVQLAEKLGIYNRVVLTGYVSDEELVTLYNGCTLFVFPSVHEGFGLPALEAMTCGAPTIGSNRTSIPEVIGRNDALFDPTDPSDMANKIAQVLTDDDFRRQLREHVTKQAAAFSWSASAKRALESFERFADRRKAGMHREGPALRYRRLVAKIAQVACDNVEISDADLAICANAIATNRSEVDRIIPSKVHGPIVQQIQMPARDLDRPAMFIDISELVQRDAKSGIQRAVRALLGELLRHPPRGFRVEPVYATVSESGYRYARRFTSEFLGGPSNAQDDEFVETKAGDIFLGLDLQADIVSAQCHYLQYIRSCGVRVHFVVYDLLPIRYPQLFPHGASKAHERWLRAIAKFDGVVCISRAVAHEVEVWLKANCPSDARHLDIKWFHMGADLENSNPSAGLPPDAWEVVDKLRSHPSFVMVGTLEPRKGHEQVLAAFETLWDNGVDANLVIVGKVGWMVDGLVKKIERHPERGGRLLWLGAISDEYLSEIYLNGTALIAASHGEGFGLPLIEASQYNLPIIARDIAVFREVAGESAYYFSARDGSGLAQEIVAWIELWKMRRAPISTNLQWLTWRHSTDQLVTCLLGDDPAGHRSSRQDTLVKIAPDDLGGTSGATLRVRT